MPNEAQQLTTLNYVDFTGGENSSVPPTSLQDNEYQKILNFEFNFNKLATRGGLGIVKEFINTINYEHDSEDFQYDFDLDVFRNNPNREYEIVISALNTIDKINSTLFVARFNDNSPNAKARFKYTDITTKTFWYGVKFKCMYSSSLDGIFITELFVLSSNGNKEQSSAYEGKSIKKLYIGTIYKGTTVKIAQIPTDEKKIKSVHYIEGTGEYIVTLKNKQAYYLAPNFDKTSIGTVEGSKKPKYCDFDGKVFLASGGKLQYATSPTYDAQGNISTAGALTSIDTSSTTESKGYNCDTVFDRFGRLVITVAGDDNVYYSSVGDPYVTDDFDGWADDSNDDSTAKWHECGYKDSGDILTMLPMADGVAVFKTNGRVYFVSNEYPNWTITQIAEHTDVLNAESIVNVGSEIVFMTNKGLKTLTTTATYGNFNTDEIARKINRSIVESIHEPMLFNLVRKRQLVIVPDTSTDEKRKHCYVYQYDIGAGVQMDFAYPIYDMQDTDNGVIIASGTNLYRWSFDYSTDNGTPIVQEIVSKKYATSNRLYTRMVDIGVEGATGAIVTMKWANKTVNYKIPEKRRMINVFSVCRDSVFGLYTTAKISLEYIKLYLFEQ